MEQKTFEINEVSVNDFSSRRHCKTNSWTMYEIKNLVAFHVCCFLYVLLINDDNLLLFSLVEREIGSVAN